MLELTVDKFTFRVSKETYYTDTGVWIRLEGKRARLGLSDFAQQRSGDMAFVEAKPINTLLKLGDEFASVETIKVTIGLLSPVAGKILQVNADLENAPEWVNQEPYGKGWIVLVELSDWERDKVRLMDAQAYYMFIKKQVEEEK